MRNKFENLVGFVRDAFNTPEAFIPLHEPRFIGNERKYVMDAIDSTFVSSVGAYVDRFEKMMTEITGAKYAVATVNGTSALHIALLLAGVQPGDEVITQPLTFVATTNAISYTGARPVFVDVDIDTMGMSPEKLRGFLQTNSTLSNGQRINKISGKKLAACVPMHTFGFPARIDEIAAICLEFDIPLVEDAAESLGSSYKGKHTGTFGKLGIFSFNGNKTVTCGGGGAVVTDDEALAKLAKHATTTAKIPHPWEYDHDMVGFNYRMPNLNAAMACAQLENLNAFIKNKRELANLYHHHLSSIGIDFLTEPPDSYANYWLMCIRLGSLEERNEVLTLTNKNSVMTRPIWNLMNRLKMYQDCVTGNLDNAMSLEKVIVNIPSSVRV